MKKGTILLFALIFSLSFITLVSAIPSEPMAFPPEPMAFYGSVTYTNGTAIPIGYYITAKMGDAVHGQCLIINNKYGYGQNSCIVVSDQNNTLINFYIGDVLIGNDYFNNMEIVNLDFTLNILPPKPTPISNGKCEPNLECSFNFLDCHVSLTSACAGNKVCDSSIGETCENTPSDCICPIIIAPAVTSSVSGGGGGGGGGGSYSKPKNTTTTNSSTNNTNIISLGSGLTDGSTGNKETTGSGKITGITGAAIGDFVKSPTGKWVIVFIILVIVFGRLFSISRNERNHSPKNIKITKLSEMKKK